MKMPLKWHRQCLENQRAHYARLREQIERLEREHAAGLKAMIAYDAQIIRADTLGFVEFDIEKFGKKRQSPQAEGSAERKS